MRVLRAGASTQLRMGKGEKDAEADREIGVLRDTLIESPSVRHS